MKLGIRNERTDGISQTSIEALVEKACDGDDYESGELENMRASMRKQTQLMVRIVEKLNLSLDELNEWFPMWGEKIEEYKH